MEPKPAKKPVRLAKHTVDITQCIQGDEFVDGKGKRHSKERQMRRIRKWVKSCWFKARKKGERGSSVVQRRRDVVAPVARDVSRRRHHDVVHRDVHRLRLEVHESNRYLRCRESR